MIRVLALCAALFPAAASAITLSDSALSASEAKVAGEFGYAINLSALGITNVYNVRITDSSARTETGGRTTGFDLDALVIGSDASDAATLTAANTYTWIPGSVPSSATLVGTNNNTSLNDAVATLGSIDQRGNNGFLSMGNSGSVLAEFTSPVAVFTDTFLFIREIGANERLASVVINETAPIPLPAGGALLLGGLGAFAMMRKRRAQA